MASANMASRDGDEGCTSTGRGGKGNHDGGDVGEAASVWAWEGGGDATLSIASLEQWPVVTSACIFIYISVTISYFLVKI